MTELQPSDFDGLVLGKKLGAGSFGTVYVGLLPTGRYVAVKQLAIEAGSDPNEINMEVEVHRRLQHANIIRYLHSKVDTVSDPANPKLLVFLEYVTGGSLTAIMKTLPGACLPVSVIKIYAKHMFQGLHYLHSNGVAHRDIKGENLLISQDTGVAKLADFDQAKVVVGTLRSGNGPAKTLAGTPYWIAPEVLTQEEGYDPMKADIWSAGCTVGEMFTGKTPWIPMSNPMGIMYKLANSQGWPDALPRAEMPEDLQSFLDNCFNRDPSARLDCQGLLDHPFLK
jgi:serine/threonine protein kinase